MNILYINHYAGGPKYGMEYRPYYLSREWVKAGHSVMILASSYSHIRSKQPDFNKKTFNELYDGISYRWYRTPFYRGNGLGRVRNMFSFIWSVFIDSNKISNDFKPDVVISSSTYPLDIFPARHIAKKTGAKLIFELHDLWPLTPIELGGMSRLHPFILLLTYAEGVAYRNSDTIVSMLPKTKKYMISRGMTPEKFNYIPNGIDDSEWGFNSTLPTDVKEKIDDIRKKRLPIMGYTGTYGLANALDTLLDVAKILKGKVEVIMVGTGSSKEQLLLRIKNENISNVTMLSAIPKSSIPAFLFSIDFAYIGWHNNPLYKYGISPNKLMDYMMASKPVIHAVDAGNDPVLESGCGFGIKPDKQENIVEAIIEMANLSSVERSVMGEKGHKFIIDNHTYKKLANNFLNLMN